MAETLRPDPLTPEPYDAAALDYWREQLTRDYSEKWDDADVLFVVGRFLATIAALRTATPDPAEPGLPDDYEAEYAAYRAGAASTVEPGLREAACLTCGAVAFDPLAGCCGECGAEDRFIGSQWLTVPHDRRPLTPDETA